MQQDGTPIDTLIEIWDPYRQARLKLMSYLHRPESLRDPVSEWSEMLAKQLLHGQFPVKVDGSIDPVAKDHDIILDADGTLVQVRTLSNLSGKWKNEHHIKFKNDVKAYAIVFFRDLQPEVLIVFPKQQLKSICERLGKDHKMQDTELQLTQCNFQQILKEKSVFTSLGIRIWCYHNSQKQWEEWKNTSENQTEQ